jgi:Fe2+ or Zn2+ uptake regulation protein
MDLDLIAKLRKEGYRFTGIRKGIMAIFKDCDCPLTVADLAKRLQSRSVKADKATIYRAINFFKAKGLIVEIEFGDGKKHYERASGKHHHHLVCVKCGKIEDVTLLHDLEDEESVISARKKFRVLRHSLEFFGICAKCLGSNTLKKFTV